MTSLGKGKHATTASLKYIRTPQKPVVRSGEGPSRLQSFLKRTVANLETVLRRNQSGGVVLENFKIYLLAHADDMILVAADPKEM